MGEIAARGDVPLPGFSPPFCSKGVIGERGGEGEFLPSKLVSMLAPCGNAWRVWRDPMPFLCRSRAFPIEGVYWRSGDWG